MGTPTQTPHPQQISLERLHNIPMDGSSYIDSDGRLNETIYHMLQLTLGLGVKIEQHCRETGQQYDGIISLPRGSSFLDAFLPRMFGMKGDQVYSMGVSTRDDGDEENVHAVVTGQMPTTEDVAGRRLLALDEVCDSGVTLEFAERTLMGLGAASVDAAVIYYKPENAARVTGYVPKFHMATTERWIIFPWEPLEDEGELSVVNGLRRPTDAEVLEVAS